MPALPHSPRSHTLDFRVDLLLVLWTADQFSGDRNRRRTYRLDGSEGTLRLRGREPGPDVDLRLRPDPLDPSAAQDRVGSEALLLLRIGGLCFGRNGLRVWQARERFREWVLLERARPGTAGLAHHDLCHFNGHGYDQRRDGRRLEARPSLRRTQCATWLR